MNSSLDQELFEIKSMYDPKNEKLNQNNIYTDRWAGIKNEKANRLRVRLHFRKEIPGNPLSAFFSVTGESGIHDQFSIKINSLSKESIEAEISRSDKFSGAMWSSAITVDVLVVYT